CRFCAEPISIRYPALELTNAVLWVGVAWLLGPSWILPGYLWFVSVTLALIATDLEHHRLPNRIVLHGAWVGLLLLGGGVLLDGVAMVRFAQAIVGGATWFGLMLAIALLARGGFGFGDVKLAALLGSFVAFQPLLGAADWYDALGAVAVAVFVSFFLGGAIAIALLALRRTDRKREIAFGPAMIIASWIAIGWGDRLLAMWLG
ncbi:MAG: prepilin peptidase, partial [Acidimicrobiia bacterium]|nr:prepilin peptidase [Acidimicrobiia bacterium]